MPTYTSSTPEKNAATQLAAIARATRKAATENIMARYFLFAIIFFTEIPPLIIFSPSKESKSMAIV